ncbi:hypothetical protein PIB30_039403 [Stylosanthes scabra]|uniref:F-box domain-containing protein n=1 Tax=Stylosanthes scabra TaxID=79078 RepID=A0ABU6QDR3_9FABA|nr:hypothetical protein [Stylosanthes scabra]
MLFTSATKKLLHIIRTLTQFLPLRFPVERHLQQMERSIKEEPVLPAIPDDIIIEIFARSDAKTVGRVRTLSTFWNQILSSNDFIWMHLKHAKKRHPSAFVHFGMKGPRSIGSWVMRFNTGAGNRELFTMPFLRNNQGKIEFVGSENGNIALRNVCDRHARALIVCNPATSTVRSIDDPMLHAGLFGTCAYAFVYKPNTLDYFWIYIYKRSIVDAHCVITSYSSVTRSWDTGVLCPVYVQVLDPKYVVHNRKVYWISWNRRGVTKPQCIVQYCLESKEFSHILIPIWSRSNMTRLLVNSDGLFFTSVHRVGGFYRWIIWKIEEMNGKYAWHLCSEYNGVGSAEYPECFAGRDIVTIQDISHVRVRGSPTVGSRISICKVNPISQHRRAL